MFTTAAVFNLIKNGPANTRLVPDGHVVCEHLRRQRVKAAVRQEVQEAEEAAEHAQSKQAAR